MKSVLKAFVSLITMLCLLTVPFTVSAEEATPLDLMPTAESGYNVVEGDGTVAITDGKLILTNNGDGDFRVLINNTTAFDLAALNALHMQFHADMPFKMAYHLISNTDTTNDWVTTTTDFNDLCEIDVAADRNPVGDYDLKMDLNTACVEIQDKSSVFFEQFIILVTGKGTFTLDTVEMITAAFDPPATDIPAEEEPTIDKPTADEPVAEAADPRTTAKKASTSSDNDILPLWLPIMIIVIVIAVVVVCVIAIVKRGGA